MPETSAMEFDLVVRRAREAGFFVQRHRDYEPLREQEGGGDLYLMPQRKFRGEHVESVLKYTTSDEIHAWLHEYAKCPND
jgi:hypothetical protein